MKILAFDTSGDILTVGFYEGARVLAEENSSGVRRHSEVLVPAIERVLRSAALELQNLDVIAVGLGPGSFTGLRVGITTAKMLAFASNKKIVGIPSLQILAVAQSTPEGPIAVLMDAKKNKVYAAVYDIKNEGQIIQLRKPVLTGVRDILKKIPRKSWVLALLPLDPGSQSVLKERGCHPVLDPRPPQAADVARMGMDLAKKNKFIRAEDLKPLYLHPRDCNVIQKSK